MWQPRTLGRHSPPPALPSSKHSLYRTILWTHFPLLNFLYSFTTQILGSCHHCLLSLENFHSSEALDDAGWGARGEHTVSKNLHSGAKTRFAVSLALGLLRPSPCLVSQASQRETSFSFLCKRISLYHCVSQTPPVSPSHYSTLYLLLYCHDLRFRMLLS